MNIVDIRDKVRNSSTNRLNKAKVEIHKVLKQYDVNIKIVNEDVVGLATEEYVVNQCIEDFVEL